MPLFIIIAVVAFIGPLFILLYCLFNWPIRTIVICAILLMVGAVKKCDAGNTISAEPQGIEWITPEGVMGYPYKKVTIKVTNHSGDFFARFELECDTQSGSISFYDYKGMSANASDTRTYKLDDSDSGASEITNCSAISVEKGKPNGYNPNNWSYGEMPAE